MNAVGHKRPLDTNAFKSGKYRYVPWERVRGRSPQMVDVIANRWAKEFCKQ